MVTINYTFGTFKNTHSGHLALLELMANTKADINYVVSNKSSIKDLEQISQKIGHFNFVQTSQCNPFLYVQELIDEYGEDVKINFFTGSEHKRLAKSMLNYFPQQICSTILCEEDMGEKSQSIAEIFEQCGKGYRQFEAVLLEEGLVVNKNHAKLLWRQLV